MRSDTMTSSLRSARQDWRIRPWLWHSGLFHKEIERIILARPAVEAGDSASPGDLQEGQPIYGRVMMRSTTRWSLNERKS